MHSFDFLREHPAKEVLWGKLAWKGSIFITDMHLVRLDMRNMGKIIEPDKCSYNWKLERIDICSYIGKSLEDDYNEHPVCRLYFDPEKFPPPRDMARMSGGCSRTFAS